MKNLSILLIVLMLMLLGCSSEIPNYSSLGRGEISPKMNTGLRVALEMLELSSNKALLVFDVTSERDEPELTLSITLPENVKLVSGILDQKYLNINVGDKISHEFALLFSEDGNYTIKATAGSEWNPDFKYWEDSSICFVVEGGIAGEIDCREFLHPITRESNLLTQVIDPFIGTFDGSEELKADSTVKIVFSINPTMNLENVTIKYYLRSDMATLVEGNAEWNGNAKKGEKIRLPITIETESAFSGYIMPIEVKVSGTPENSGNGIIKAIIYTYDNPNAVKPLPTKPGSD